MSKKEKKLAVEIKLPRTTLKLAELAAQIHGISLKQYMASAVANATISDLVRLDECLTTIESRQEAMAVEKTEEKVEEVKEEKPVKAKKPATRTRAKKVAEEK